MLNFRTIWTASPLLLLLPFTRAQDDSTDTPTDIFGSDYPTSCDTSGKCAAWVNDSLVCYPTGQPTNTACLCASALYGEFTDCTNCILATAPSGGDASQTALALIQVFQSTDYCGLLGVTTATDTVVPDTASTDTASPTVDTATTSVATTAVIMPPTSATATATTSIAVRPTITRSLTVVNGSSSYIIELSTLTLSTTGTGSGSSTSSSSSVPIVTSATMSTASAAVAASSTAAKSSGGGKVEAGALAFLGILGVVVFA